MKTVEEDIAEMDEIIGAVKLQFEELPKLLREGLAARTGLPVDVQAKLLEGVRLMALLMHESADTMDKIAEAYAAGDLK